MSRGVSYIVSLWAANELNMLSGWFFCTDHRGRARQVYAGLWRRSCRYVYPIRKSHTDLLCPRLTLSYSYSEGRIVEINSHSLFSKWFSESGKLVQKLFSAVHGMIENPDCFVIVMIGE